MPKCTTPWCSNTRTPNAKLGPCDSCRSAMHRLLRLKRSDQISYVERQAKFNARTKLVMSITEKGDASPIPAEHLQAAGILMFNDVDKEKVAELQRKGEIRHKGVVLMADFKKRAYREKQQRRSA